MGRGKPDCRILGVVNRKRHGGKAHQSIDFKKFSYIKNALRIFFGFSQVRLGIADKNDKIIFSGLVFPEIKLSQGQIRNA